MPARSRHGRQAGRDLLAAKIPHTSALTAWLFQDQIVRRLEGMIDKAARSHDKRRGSKRRSASKYCNSSAKKCRPALRIGPP